MQLPEPAPRAPEAVPEEELARLLAEVHGAPARLRKFVEQVAPELVLKLAWDRGVHPIAQDLVELLDRRGLPSDFFAALESLAPGRADEVAALRERWARRKPPPRGRPTRKRPIERGIAGPGLLTPSPVIFVRQPIHQRHTAIPHAPSPVVTGTR